MFFMIFASSAYSDAKAKKTLPLTVLAALVRQDELKVASHVDLLFLDQAVLQLQNRDVRLWDVDGREHLLCLGLVANGHSEKVKSVILRVAARV